MRPVLLFLTALVLLAACGGPHQDAGRQVLRLNLFAGVNALDPAYANNEAAIRVCQQVYSGLVRLDTALNVVPDVAAGWDISPDGTRYTFRIRPGVRYAPDACFAALPDSTREVRARDFVFALHRVAAPATASPGAWVLKGKVVGVEDYAAGRADTIGGIWAVGDSLLVIQLSAPFPPFLALLSMPYAFAVPPEAVAHYGAEFRTHPVGCGPFRLAHWQPGQRVVLHRNPVYWEAGLPKLDAVEFQFRASKLAAYTEFRYGALDMLDALDPAVARDILASDGRSLRPELAAQYRIWVRPQLTLEYFGCRVGDTTQTPRPLRDARIRRAILHGIDRAALCRTVLRGQAIPAGGLVPPGLAGFPLPAPGPVTDALYNPELSARLLAEAGFPGGQGLPPLTLYSTPNYRLISEFTQHQLAQIGFTVNIEEREGATLREAIYGGQADFWRASWIADYPDPENFLGLLHSAQWAPGGPNTTRFALPAFDSLFAAALAQPQDSLRAPQYAQLDSLATAHAPIIPLFFYQTVRLLKPHVRGFRHAASPLVLDLRFVEVGDASRQ